MRLWRHGVGAVAWIGFALSAYSAPPTVDHLADAYAAASASYSAERDGEKQLPLADALLDLQEKRLKRDASSRDPRRAQAAARCGALIEKDRPDLSELRQQQIAAAVSQTEFQIAETARLYEAWLLETDSKKRGAIEGDLISAAVHSCHHPEVVAEIAAGGGFEEKQLPLPAKAASVLLTPIHPFGRNLPGHGTVSEHPWVIRRMTTGNFELWSPDHGWLFDTSGKIVNEARPPRRDGLGREWYGAFLPDGRWVTTDIWDGDTTLHFFSAKGKWILERKGASLIPRAAAEKEFVQLGYIPLIGWCRSDREGRRWILSVGSDGGGGMASVSPEGQARPVSDPWALCYPRDLEPKGMYIALTVPDDFGRAQLLFSSVGHGMWVTYPQFSLASGKWGAVIPEAQTGSFHDGFHSPGFGFWPRSRAIYISAADTVPGSAERPITWLYRADGAFAGWIAATRIADAEEGRAMLFDMGQGKIATLDPDFHVRAVRRFGWPDGTAATPEKLFPDLHLGFFWRQKAPTSSDASSQELVLARW